jgi:ribosomal protein L37AE/L43A
MAPAKITGDHGRFSPIPNPMTAWLALAAGEDREHGGNDGYDDNPSAHYSWDDTVANHNSIRSGDQIVLRDKRTLLGASTIDSIVEDRLVKQFHSCPRCGKAGIKPRKTKQPRFRCQDCSATFKDPDTNSREVVTYRSRHDIAWIDLGGQLAATELRVLCMSPRSQLSIRELDWPRFEHALRETDPTLRLTITEARRDQIVGGHRPATVRARIGQAAFRSRLLAQFNEVCAFTGPAPRVTLEAAHLYRFSDSGQHHDDGGLLLRRDVHRLFDLGQIAVDPETTTIDVGEDLSPFAEYGCLQGRQLQVPMTNGHRRWLQAHWRLHRTDPGD